MRTINEILFDFAQALLRGSVNLSDPYFKFDGYGHIYTYKRSEIRDDIDFYELAQFLTERQDLLEEYIGE